MMAGLPLGTVTFLFTDIESSTRLWEQQPAAMQAALARHDALLRHAIEAHGGHVFKTVGDAFYAAFATAHGAVQAAVEAQQALQEQVPSLGVRMALHTGAAEARHGDYFGPALNLVARLLAAAHGGQVLLSQATVKILRPSLPQDIGLHALGTHRLLDIATSETIYQLFSPGLPSDFPPLNTLDVAFRRGLARASAIAAVIIAIMAGLILAAEIQARRADHQRRFAQEAQQNLRRHLYAAQMSVAQQDWNDGNIDQATALLKALMPPPGQEDLRGFEWRYLWRLCQESDALVTFRGHKGAVDYWGLHYSPDGQFLASCGEDDKTVRLWGGKTRRAAAVLPWFTDRVGKAAFSRDGRILAVCAGKLGHRMVRLWDVVGRRELPPLQGHTGWINEVVFSPDGRTLATASTDRTVRLWNLPSRQAIATLTGHKDSVGSLAFSPDGKILASGSNDKTVWLWHMPGGRLQAAIHVGDNWKLVFSPDGRTLVSLGGEDIVKLWDAATGQAAGTLKGHRSAVQDVAFSPDGKLLASASDDNTVKLWDFATRREAATLKGHRSVVVSLAFSPDGRKLASASDDFTARLWDVTSKQEVATFRGHRAEVWSVAFSPDGRKLGTAGVDGAVKLWDATVRDADVLQGHHGGIRAVRFSPEGRTLASASPYDGTVKLWDVAWPGLGGRFRQLATLKVPTNEFHSLAFTPDGRTLALCGIDKSVKLWDVASQQPIASLSTHGSPPSAVVFSPDGKTLACGGGRWGMPSVVRLWEIALPGPKSASRAREVAAFKGHTSAVWAAAFSPDGKLLASASADGTVRLWDVAARRRVAALRGHALPVNDLAFSPDGKILASGGDDHTVKLWDVAARHERATLTGYPGVIDSLAFSPDGKTLATGGASNVVTLWNVATQQPVATLAGHQAQVISLAFSPDGNTLATGSFDATIRLWRAARFAETDAPAGTSAAPPSR